MSMEQQRQACAQRLTAQSARVRNLNAFVGLDGFVDEILHVVDKRESATKYTRLPTIKRYAERLAQAAGRSTNVELVSQMTKLGGNGPIMANALASLGLKVAYVGNLGYPNLHPVFEEFAKRADVTSIAEPGYTDALEFEDGKLMVGKHQSLREVTWANLDARMGHAKFEQKLKDANLIAFVNWTMLTAMSDIWEHIQRDIATRLGGTRRLLFVDLADPEKRTNEDIRHALDLVGRFQSTFDTVLGLNLKESGEVARVLDFESADSSPEQLSRLAARIRTKLNVHSVVIHPVECATVADAKGTCSVEGPFTAKPRLTTGAGDHFNAGFCLGHLLGLSNEDSLWLGVSTSGFYVRNAKSPSASDLVTFLNNWPAREAIAVH